MNNHIADAEATFVVTNVTPDLCKVGNAIVPFDIYQVLTPEKHTYSPNVVARGNKVLMVDSVVSGTIGNAGSGIISQVSGGSGHTVIVQGSATVHVNGECVAHDLCLCMMNVKV